MDVGMQTQRNLVWCMDVPKKSGFGLGANECGVEDVPDVRLGR
jgi:hypothetical protein